MAELRLFGGESAQIDDEDLARLSGWRWRIGNRGRIISNGPFDGSLPSSTYSLHRVVMGLEGDTSRIVVCLDGNLLNCHKANLVITTKREHPPNPNGRPRVSTSDDVLEDSDTRISALVTNEQGQRVLRSLPRNRTSRADLVAYRELHPE